MHGRSKISLVCLLAMMFWFTVVNSAHSQEKPVLTFLNDGKVHLRWPALHDADLVGYNVYRKMAGEQAWSKLTEKPVSMVYSLDEIRRIAGYKADLYLELFGANDPPQDIPLQRYREIIADQKDLSFLEVMTLINPELGPLLGVVFIDDTGLPSGLIEYRVTALIQGREMNYAASGELNTRSSGLVPAVTGLMGSAGHQSAYLTWDKDNDALRSGAVVTYAVFRSDNLLGPFEQINYYGILPVTIASGERTSRKDTEEYKDNYLENGRKYYYHVKAVNAFGFTGPPSATIEITPADNRMPDPPRRLIAVKFGTGLKLSWLPVKSAVAGYEIYKSTDRQKPFRKIHPATDILLRPDTFLIDLDVKTGLSYYYFAVSVSEAGIQSPSSDTLFVFLEDTKPPDPPGPVETVVERGRVSLYWPKSKEEDVIGYEVERSSDDLFRSRLLLTNDIIPDTVFIDTLPEKSETTYGYFVYSVDRSYNRSEPSEMVKAKLPDRMPPSVPVMTGLESSGKLVKLSWTKSTESDLRAFKIYGSISSASSLKAIDISLVNSYTDTLESSGTYYYAVSAIDSAGNESGRSGVLSVNYDEHEVPEMSSGGTVKKSGNFLRIEWEPVNQSGTAGYLVTRVDVETGKKLDVAEVKVPGNSYTDRFADPGKEYEYRIRTFDTKWRMSEALELEYQPGK